MNNTLHSRIQRRAYQVSQALNVDTPVVIFQTPGACFGCDIIYLLHTTYSLLQRCSIGQVSLYHLNACQAAQAARILYRSHESAYLITALYQHINKVTT
jgi:hypothetical protein